MKKIYYKIRNLTNSNMLLLLVAYCMTLEIVIMKCNFTGANILTIVILRSSQYVSLYFAMKIKVLDLLYLHDKRKDRQVARSYKEYWQNQLKNIEEIDYHDDDVLAHKRYILNQIAHLERTFNV